MELVRCIGGCSGCWESTGSETEHVSGSSGMLGSDEVRDTKDSALETVGGRWATAGQDPLRFWSKALSNIGQVIRGGFHSAGCP